MTKVLLPKIGHFFLRPHFQDFAFRSYWKFNAGISCGFTEHRPAYEDEMNKFMRTFVGISLDKLDIQLGHTPKIFDV